MRAFEGKSVLVLEDEYFLAMDMETTLKQAGASVVGPFSSARPALQCIIDAAPDLAVLDINLLGAVDYQIADWLADHQIPFVFASGYEPTDLPARHAGVPFCQKPLRPERVLAALAKLARSTSVH